MLAAARRLLTQRSLAVPSAGRHQAALAALCMCALLLSACGTAPIRSQDVRSPALARIDKAFAQTVAAAHKDPHAEWHSGWTGNMWVNFWGNNNLGLCYQWQRLVYDGVIDTVHQVGWQATGIVINKGTPHEHHAVLVYDPHRIGEKALLTAARTRPVFVLDAWRRGQADIYRLADWTAMPFWKKVPAQLQSLKR